MGPSRPLGVRQVLAEIKSMASEDSKSVSCHLSVLGDSKYLPILSKNKLPTVKTPLFMDFIGSYAESLSHFQPTLFLADCRLAGTRTLKNISDDRLNCPLGVHPTKLWHRVWLFRNILKKVWTSARSL